MMIPSYLYENQAVKNVYQFPTKREDDDFLATL